MTEEMLDLMKTDFQRILLVLPDIDTRTFNNHKYIGELNFVPVEEGSLFNNLAC